MRVLIHSGRVIDCGRLDGVADIVVENGRIAAVEMVTQKPGAGETKSDSHQADRIIDATGKIVVPGLMDMHVHLREPGQTHKETIQSGLKAAARGGFTAVCAMPNTLPVNDCKDVTRFILNQAQKAQSGRVYPVAAISLGSRGEVLSDFEALKSAGAVALSDDGLPVDDSRLMLAALKKAKKINLPLISHCEDLKLTATGVMNQGATARRLGLKGIPNAAESKMVLRDIELCSRAEAPLHIAHVSKAESVAAIRQAKKKGISLTAETAPHYFTLTDEAVAECGTNAKMNPPLGSAKDRQAVLEGLSDGTLDTIATDHAPHSVAEKKQPFENAPNGIIGLETALGLSLKLVTDGVLTIDQLVAKLTLNPARILGLVCGIKKGNPADITIIDPKVRYRVEADTFASLSRNTPFDNWELKGCAVLTMVGGKIVYEALEQAKDRL